MATRILPLALLTLALGASACALQPLDPGEDPAGEQSTTLTTTASSDSPGSVTAPTTVRTPPILTATDGRGGLSTTDLRTSAQSPDKPQPDPWNGSTSESANGSSATPTTPAAGSLPTK